MRLRIWAFVVLVGLGLAVDLTRAPDHQVGARVAVAGIHVYQATLSRVFAVGGVACRFDPTCSHYGEEVIRRFGLMRGGWMATKRVLRCGPWTPMGTSDTAPAAG